MVSTGQERLDDGTLMHAVIMGKEGDGLTITTEDGRPAMLAVIDAETGEVIESGTEVGEEVWDVVVEAYRRFLIGKQALRVISSPQGFFGEREPEQD